MYFSEKRVLFYFTLILAILIYVVPSTADSGDYEVESAYNVEIDRPPQDPVSITFWELRPREMAIVLVLLTSPALILPVELLFLIKMFAYLGYKKITQKNVLYSQTRLTIYETIQINPGISLNDLSRKTNITSGTLKYHLSILKMTGKIITLDSTGNARYFENTGKYEDLERKILKYVRNKKECAIFEFLLKHPFATRKDLEELLGISGASVSWHMRRLCDDEILSIKKIGRNVNYEINPEAMKYLLKYLQTSGV